jgi:hypothetical protein
MGKGMLGEFLGARARGTQSQQSQGMGMGMQAREKVAKGRVAEGTWPKLGSATFARLARLASPCLSFARLASSHALSLNSRSPRPSASVHASNETRIDSLLRAFDRAFSPPPPPPSSVHSPLT